MTVVLESQLEAYNLILLFNEKSKNYALVSGNPIKIGDISVVYDAKNMSESLCYDKNQLRKEAQPY